MLQLQFIIGQARVRTPLCEAARRQFLSQFITKAAAVAGGDHTFDVFLLEAPGGRAASVSSHWGQR